MSRFSRGNQESLCIAELVLALIVATTEVKDKTSPEIYVLLQIFVIGGSIIRECLGPFPVCRHSWTGPVDIVYTTGLIIVSMITVSAFDGDVWIRDIDSSPSPFPMAVLIAFLRPRPSAWLHRGSDEQDRTDMTERSRLEVHCLSPCICPPKPEWTRWPEESEVDASRGPMKNARSLSHILVRVPDAAEQRTSISISFEAVR